MDRERVLRDVQCSIIPSDGNTCIDTDLKENTPPGECSRYKQAYHSCVQRNSGLMEAMESERMLVSKLSGFQSMKVSSTLLHVKLDIMYIHVRIMRVCHGTLTGVYIADVHWVWMCSCNQDCVLSVGEVIGCSK